MNLIASKSTKRTLTFHKKRREQRIQFRHANCGEKMAIQKGGNGILIQNAKM